jgi:hypothetical protein
VHGALNLVEQIAVMPGINPVGCYPHATHVAGIAAGSNNVGMLSGARIVSISVATSNSGSCATSLGSVASFAAALEAVYSRVLASGQAGVVNMSYNGQGVFGQYDTVGIKMRKVSTSATLWPDWTWYPGALVVQSAGNKNQDACLHAYDGTSASDGILVVGGITRTGQTMSPSTANEAGIHNYTIATDERGTNFGSCVEVHTPASRIRSTWSAGSYQRLSGTSMAAPFVSGLAAWLIETEPGITGNTLEQRVRSRLGTISTAFGSLAMPQVWPQSYIALPTAEISVGLPNIADPFTPFFFYASDVPVSVSGPQLNVGIVAGQRGATSCTLIRTSSNPAFNQTNTFTNQFGVATQVLPPGQYTWQLTCMSSQQTTSTVNATVNLLP